MTVPPRRLARRLVAAMVSACDGRGRLQAVRREACIAGVPDRVGFSWPIGGDSWGGSMIRSRSGARGQWLLFGARRRSGVRPASPAEGAGRTV